jgi:hypothetical protein
MNKWILTSFFTAKTGYEKLVPHFKQTAVAAGIPEMIVDEISNQRDWHKNTHWKAKLIRAHLIDLAGLYEAVVFVDIDARFYSYPKLFDDLRCDFAAHFRNWRHAREELLSGTLFFRINKRCLDLVEDWIALNKANPKIWEQKNLQRAFKRASSLIHDKLPIEYCMIFDDPLRPKIEPVIEHFQASRKLRYEVSK